MRLYPKEPRTHLFGILLTYLQVNVFLVIRRNLETERNVIAEEGRAVMQKIALRKRYAIPFGVRAHVQ